MRPLQKAAGRYSLMNNAADPDFIKTHLRLVRWGDDALPFAGRGFPAAASRLLLDNKIVRGEFEAPRREGATSRDITVPVLHMLAEHDHVVP